MQFEILAAVFDLILKQQLNLWLFLSDLNYKMLGLTDLPGHHGKVTSDKKMIFISHQRNKCVMKIIAAIVQWHLKQQVIF